MNDSLTFSRRVPVTAAPDVLVAGGGIAGCMAAIAAARAGAQTLLVESYGFLGGIPVMNFGQHACFCGDSARQGEVFDELVTELEKIGATVPYEPWVPDAILRFTHEHWDYSVARYFDSNVFQIMLLEMARREKNLQLLLHTRVVDLLAAGGAVDTVLIHNHGGLQAVRPRFVVDGTGDAHLAHMAGFPCVEGREGDGLPIPLALFISLREIGEVATSMRPAWAPVYTDAANMPMTALTLRRERRADFRLKVAGYDPLDAQQLSQAESHARLEVLSVVEFLQAHGYSTWQLDSISMQIGTRIGRRIVGEYTLTADDCRRGARFEDGIGRGSCNLSDKSLMDGSSDRQTHADLAVEVVPPYQIPYRSLVPTGSHNLLVAGRCLSADAWALSSARMMPACAMMGQAAGMAAAWCAGGRLSPLDLDIVALQHALKAKGAEF